MNRDQHKDQLLEDTNCQNAFAKKDIPSSTPAFVSLPHSDPKLVYNAQHSNISSTERANSLQLPVMTIPTLSAVPMQPSTDQPVSTTYIQTTPRTAISAIFPGFCRVVSQEVPKSQCSDQIGGIYLPHSALHTPPKEFIMAPTLNPGQQKEQQHTSHKQPLRQPTAKEQDIMDTLFSLNQYQHPYSDGDLSHPSPLASTRCCTISNKLATSASTNIPAAASIYPNTLSGYKINKIAISGTGTTCSKPAENKTVRRLCPVPTCNKSFEKVKLLKAHILKIHRDLDTKSLLDKLGPAERTQACPLCDKAYAFKSGLYRHLRDVHPQEADGIIPSKHDSRFPCFFCDISPFKSVLMFIQHIQVSHPAQFEESIDYSVRIYPSLNAANEWLQQEQDSTFAEYLLRYNHKTDAVQTWNSSRVRVVCRMCRVCARNRPPPETDRKRRPYRQKSHKGVGICLSRMWWDVAADGRVRVRFLRNHSHKCSPEHIAIPKVMRDFIAAQISAGLSSLQVLSSLRAAFLSQERASLVTLQDINNIARANSSSQFSCEDVTDVFDIVQNLNCKNPDTLLILKLPGESSFELPPIIRLEHTTNQASIGDFIFILQTVHQKELMKECGTRGLCLHIVWQTNRQNYPVLVLMGELDNRAAVSLAFCITSRNSPCIQKLLLANATLPLNIHPRVYCSTEDAFVENQFILPWPSTRTIMCTWRLKHTWLSAFQERASTKASGLKAFKALVVLLRADSPDVFDVRWDGFCSLWFPTEPKVVEYVKNRYYSRKELWAPAFRKTTEISISNIVEELDLSMSTHFQKDPASIPDIIKKLRALDTTQQSLIDQLELHGTNSLIHSDAARAKDLGILISQTTFPIRGVSMYKVKSQTDAELDYTVTRIPTPNCAACDKIPCIHALECTCFDYAVSRTRVCSHTGAVMANTARQWVTIRRSKEHG